MECPSAEHNLQVNWFTLVFTYLKFCIVLLVSPLFLDLEELLDALLDELLDELPVTVLCLLNCLLPVFFFRNVVFFKVLIASL